MVSSERPRMLLYLIGSLRNPAVPKIASELRAGGYDVFDDWFAAGPEADDYWQAYEQGRGHTLAQALDGYAAGNVFRFDKTHLDRAEAGVLVMPAGKSGHLELGYLVGQGKPTYVLMPGEPDRWDVMYRFTRGVYTSLDELLSALQAEKKEEV